MKVATHKGGKWSERNTERERDHRGRETLKQRQREIEGERQRETERELERVRES